MTIILFLVVLAILIFVHELGHFVSAKLFGIRVDEFAIGFPPRIISWKMGETDYSLNLIPIGGYVKIFGEDPDEESMKSERSFANAAKWKQLVILLSGIFMNLVFAWFLISVSFNIGLLMPVDSQYKDNVRESFVVITSVVKDSPAENSGLVPGDKILSITDEGLKLSIENVEQVQKAIAGSKGAFEMEYERKDSIGTAEITALEGITKGKKAIGITMDLAGIVKFGFFESFYEGAKLTFIYTKNITIGIYHLIADAIGGQNGVLSGVSGPVGIANMVGQAGRLGASYLFGFMAIVSINLAILNLIPFPALDGGRALFVLAEVFIGKRIKPIILNWANTIGFFLLLVLLLFITYKDILRLI